MNEESVVERQRVTTVIKAQASTEFNPWTTSIFPSSKYTIDKFRMPTDWHEIIKLCYYFYEREGIIKSVIDKQVEISLNGLNVLTKNQPDEEKLLYDYVTSQLLDFLSVAATEYYVSGLVVPEIVWGPLPKEISGFSRDYEIPVDLWVRDPSQIDLKPTPLPNHVLPVWKIPSEDILFIQNDGKYTDGTEDTETFDILKSTFPEFVSKVKNGEVIFPLPGRFVIRRKPLLRSQYPIPYLMSALELLVHKRNLRAMDYALISRVINAILHIRVGNDTYPLSEDDEDILDSIEQQFNRNRNASNQERIFQFLSNHTVEMEWVVPPLDALLNNDKYAQINQEILYSLGFPKFLITGEKDKSNTGSTSSALLSPVNSMTALRREFSAFLHYLFTEMAKRNGLSESPRVSFAPLNLVELSELIQLSMSLEDKGVISKSSLAKLAGFDFDAEQLLRENEDKKLFKPEDDGEVNEEDNIEQQDQDSL